MRPNSTFLVLSLFAAFCVGKAHAREATLGSLKLRHEVAISHLGSSTKKLDEAYKGQLEKLSEQAKAKGDLDQILFIKREIEAVEGGHPGPEVPSAYTEVVRARSIYDIERSKLALGRAKEVRALRDEHRQRLLALQQSLTRRGKLDEAIAVKAEITALDALIRADAPVGSRSRPGMAAPAGTPGKLVVFGEFGGGKVASTPEEFADDAFVAVAAGYEHWLALAADGKVVGRPDGRSYFEVPEGTKDVVSMGCGRHMHMLVHKDGSVTGLSSEHHLPTIPEDLGKVAKISVGHSVQSAMLEDGKVVMFGYALREKPFPHPDLLVDAADIAMNVHSLFMRKRDGSVVAYNRSGEEWTRPESLDKANIVAMAGGLSLGCLFLTDRGKVISYKVLSPPEDLPKVKAISVGEQMAAAQKMDGTWVVWGGGKKNLRDSMNAKLEELGPLKSLDMGKEFFVAIR